MDTARGSGTEGPPTSPADGTWKTQLTQGRVDGRRKVEVSAWFTKWVIAEHPPHLLPSITHQGKQPREENETAKGNEEEGREDAAPRESFSGTHVHAEKTRHGAGADSNCGLDMEAGRAGPLLPPRGLLALRAWSLQAPTTRLF